MKKFWIPIIVVASCVGAMGIYTAFDYLIKPTVKDLEEITPSSFEQSFIIDEENKPTPSCHASTIVNFKNKFYSAWFGGTGESKPDVTIWLSSSDDCATWSTPVDMSDIKNIAHWNPVLFAKGDTLYLYYKIGLHPDNWTTYVRESNDGVAWTQEHLMIEGDKVGRGPVKNKPIELSDGSVLAPASIEYSSKMPDCYVERTTDMVHWERGKNVHSKLFVEKIQPALVETDPGVVRMYIRTNRGRIYESTSKNYGKSFGRARPIALYNNNSGVDVAKNKDGVLALVHNPVEENWGDRSPLIVAFSYDKGETWTKQITIESEPGEYSYPAIISKDNKFYVTYTYNRSLIRCTTFTL